MGRCVFGKMFTDKGLRGKGHFSNVRRYFFKKINLNQNVIFLVRFFTKIEFSNVDSFQTRDRRESSGMYFSETGLCIWLPVIFFYKIAIFLLTYRKTYRKDPTIKVF